VFYRLTRDDWDDGDYDLDHYLNWLMPRIFTEEELAQHFGGDLPLPVEVSWNEDAYGGRAFLPSWSVQVWGSDEDAILNALAHELTHIAQSMRYRYYPDWDGSVEWDGQTFPADMPYEDRPWEHDASKAGHGLSIEYITMSALDATE
jgi:hypothetical protein